MRLTAAYLIGLIFGLGIVISGMVNPAKVLNFFDVPGSWDPSLAFVMGGALLITAIGYRFVLNRKQPCARYAIPDPSKPKGRHASDWRRSHLRHRLGDGGVLSRRRFAGGWNGPD